MNASTEEGKSASEETGTIDLGMRWHSMSASEAARALLSDMENGLDDEDVNRRLVEFGPNELATAKSKSALLRFLSQFNDFIIWVLLAAAVLSGVFLREFVDAGVIMAIVIMNALLGFIQEARAEKALEEIKKLGSPEAKVIRGGAELSIASRGVVPGDLIILEAGDVVPADARVVSSMNLRANESSLTGEAYSVEKYPDVVVDEESPVADRINMVFSGTHIGYGRGRALVTATGQRSELGKIASMIEEAGERATPLQANLKQLGKKIVYACLLISAVVFIFGILKKNDEVNMLLFAVSLAVAAIPEGLPAILTITLALATQAMARRNAIVRRLPAVETLGCASYICSDKTGTITENRMNVEKIVLPDCSVLPVENLEGGTEVGGRAALLLKAVTLCNDSRKTGEGEIAGDPTEVALIEAGERAGLIKEELEALHPRIAEIPFDSDVKMMTTFHRAEGKILVFSKGAPEKIISSCGYALTDGRPTQLTDDMRAGVLEVAESLASGTLRTIAASYRETREALEESNLSEMTKDMIFLGVVAMKDPPRPEVEQALETCENAHIEVAMITGDHRATAAAVAEEVGILKNKGDVMEGKELETISVEELSEKVERVGVFARVSPLHKVKIVDALKSLGHVVAMTGDGVNDAPALKKADIGIAMGVTGTDVAKEASDMVLADDNFATIVEAVREGRIIFSNLKKFIYFLLSANIGIVLSLFIAMLIGFRLPLLPVQILWINLITNGMPALALGREPPEPGVMSEPPRDPGENILALSRIARLFWQGGVLAIGALASILLARYLLGHAWAPGEGLDLNRTVLFTTIVISDLLHSYNWRSEKRSFLGAVPWENRFLAGAFGLSVALQVLVIYSPFMQKAFHTITLSPGAWGIVLGCSILPVLVIDRLKVWFYRHYHPGERRGHE